MFFFSTVQNYEQHRVPICETEIIRNIRIIRQSDCYHKNHGKIDKLVLPSGSNVSNALRGYAEHVILLYLQNSRALSSNISRKTLVLANLHDSVSGVNLAAFIMPLLAGTLGCFKAYPNMLCDEEIIKK